MNKQELKDFLSLVQGTYSSIQANEAVNRDWSIELKDMPAELIYEALKQHQRDTDGNYAPNPRQIIKKAQDLCLPELSISFDEAKYQNSYLYNLAVATEGSIRPYDVLGIPDPISTNDMRFVEKDQITRYETILKKCRNIPFEFFPLLRNVIKKRESLIARKPPSFLPYGQPTPFRKALELPDPADAVNDYLKSQDVITDTSEKFNKLLMSTIKKLERK